MTHVSDIAFTPAVRAQQQRLGSRGVYARMVGKGAWSDRIDATLEAFLADRDSFYLGTASAAGRPYIQHRGGPRGFLRVLDDATLAFADYAGNRQYITLGNLAENPQAYLFLIDYPNRQRVKIWSRAEIVEDDPALLDRLVDENYNARPERAIVFHVEAWDINCPQHIRPRYTEDELPPLVEKLRARVREFEEKLAALEQAGRREAATVHHNNEARE